MTVTKKLRLAFTIILILFSMILLILDNVFLDDFYILTKKKDLWVIYGKVSILVKEEGAIEASSDNQIIEYSSDSGGIRILIFDVNGESLNTSKVIDLSSFKVYKNDDNYIDTQYEYENKFKEEGEIVYFEDTTIKGNRTNTNIAVIGKIIKDNQIEGYILAYTPLIALESTIRIFNIFIVIVTIFGLSFSLTISYVFSYHFVKPIREMEKVTRQISNLDFSDSVSVDTSDEIGMLSLSINKMSKELEKNIEELKEVNTKLKEDIELKDRVNIFKEEFISNVSHELKTPISIIAGYSEALKLEGLSQDDINDYADIIIDESKRMNKLVRDLIKYTQIESGFLELDSDEFSLFDLVDPILKPEERIITEKGVELVTNFENVHVIGDFDMLETVLQNYLSNAIHYVTNERIIRITGERKGDKYRMSIYNSGDEIPLDKIDRIWDSFYKVDKARVRSYGGSGLGLSIVSTIMKAYGNEFGVINKGDGVEFFFDLNIKQD